LGTMVRIKVKRPCWAPVICRTKEAEGSCSGGVIGCGIMGYVKRCSDVDQRAEMPVYLVLAVRRRISEGKRENGGFVLLISLRKTRATTNRTNYTNK